MWYLRLTHTSLYRSDAYKHLEVCESDRCLQVLRVGNRYFVEEKVFTLLCNLTWQHP